jgi:hypothetical protein
MKIAFLFIGYPFLSCFSLLQRKRLHKLAFDCPGTMREYH